MISSWINLTQESQLKEISENKTETIVIFKHSTRCGISAHAMHKLESYWDFKDTEIKFYYLDLISFREISNKIAQVFNVTHQSPQILMLKKGSVVDNFSHQSISIDRIRKNLS